MEYVFKEIVAFWEAHKECLAKASTMSCYRLFIRKHLLPFFGESKSVTSDDVQSFVNDRLASGLSVKTVKDLVTLLGGIVSYGHVRYGFPKEEWEVVFPRTPRRDMAVLSWMKAGVCRLHAGRSSHSKISPSCWRSERGSGSGRRVAFSGRT